MEQRAIIPKRFQRTQHASFSAGCAAAAAIYYWVGFWCLLVPVAVGALMAILTEED